MQLASLEENKEQNMTIISTLKEAVQKKEFEIHTLSENIKAKECQEKEQISIELADMKTIMIQLQTENNRLCMKVKLHQEEAQYYEKQATFLLKTTCTKVKMQKCTLISMHAHQSW